MRASILPVLTVSAGIVVLWYLGAVWLNWQVVADMQARAGNAPDFGTMVALTLSHARPLLPAPHQIIVEMWNSLTGPPITSPRSLVNHALVTLSAALAGFGLGSLAGVLLAVAIIHVRALERSLMPWIIAAQTIPILAIAPMVIVVLGSMGFTGLLPKSLISMYLCFFPVTIGMVKGLTSPETMQLDLMRTYNASASEVLWKLRFPASVPFLFTSLKVAVAIALTGAIVGELPTGAVAGIGARLLQGSYYGQTVQIWAALFMGSFIAAGLVWLVGVIEGFTLKRMGARP